jgi:hypothetical protein
MTLTILLYIFPCLTILFSPHFKIVLYVRLTVYSIFSYPYSVLKSIFVSYFGMFRITVEKEWGLSL